MLNCRVLHFTVNAPLLSLRLFPFLIAGSSQLVRTVLSGYGTLKALSACRPGWEIQSFPSVLWLFCPTVVWPAGVATLILIYGLSEVISLLIAVWSLPDIRATSSSDSSSFQTQPIHTLKGHSLEVSCLLQLGDPLGLIVSGSLDATIKLWDPSNGKSTKYSKFSISTEGTW